MKEIAVEAIDTNLTKVTEFINSELETVGCGKKQIMQIDLAVEEIYVNIAHYAYNPEVGKVSVTCRYTDNPPQIAISFADSGKQFDPLEKDVSEADKRPKQRKMGGLGIHLAKKLMDSVDYRFKDGNNILTISKIIG